MKKTVVILTVMLFCTVALFAGARPSVTAKPAPSLATITGKDGVQRDADVVAIYVESGEQSDLRKDVDIRIYSKLQIGQLDGNKRRLMNDSYEQMASYGDLAQLISGLGADFDEMYPGVDSDCLIATDIFFLETEDEIEEALILGENNYVEVALKPIQALQIGEVPFVAYYSQKIDGWQAVSPEDVSVTVTGTLQVTLGEVGPVVLIKAVIGDSANEENISGVVAADSAASVGAGAVDDISAPQDAWGRLKSFFSGIFNGN